ncbi:MAG: 2-oxoacid:ferredoxin oxidoreductase subunit beta [Planctomycetota bacterium]|jgi:2-oxoglutarate ferredoxin oxidoreductase subunit beta|nr:2-oxoacid:ferredoxin oxidoreductase subunit beta [Planctomycetota bacterium]
MTTETPTYKKKDFVSDQEVRWCPGCGDYAILNGVQQAFASFGVPKEKFAVVSGIGCSSRFPYYMNTFGFHSIHGRAPAIASGIKIANPDLHVWVITGDGDALSIGGNHLIHAMRRNIDIKVLLFNNRIYGLTKGQYSPTTVPGKNTPSSPYGSLDEPFNPISLALGAGASFVARTVDTQIKHLKDVVAAAHEHKGFAFVEILQNCVIFNDGAFGHVTDKEVRDDRQVDLRDGQPMLFGKEKDKGLRFTSKSLEICSPEEADTWQADGPTGANAFRICQACENGEIPVPIGILRQVERPVLDETITKQVSSVTESLGEGTLEGLLSSGDTWDVS